MDKKFNLRKERMKILARFDHSVGFIHPKTGRHIQLIDIVNEVLENVKEQDREFITNLKLDLGKIDLNKLEDYYKPNDDMSKLAFNKLILPVIEDLTGG